MKVLGGMKPERLGNQGQYSIRFGFMLFMLFMVILSLIWLARPLLRSRNG